MECRVERDLCSPQICPTQHPCHSAFVSDEQFTPVRVAIPLFGELLITWKFPLTLIRNLPTAMQWKEMVENTGPGVGQIWIIGPGSANY